MVLVLFVLSVVSETPSESQHQVVGIVEVVQFVAYVQEKIPVQVGFRARVW